MVKIYPVVGWHHKLKRGSMSKARIEQSDFLGQRILRNGMKRKKEPTSFISSVFA